MKSQVPIPIPKQILAPATKTVAVMYNRATVAKIKLPVDVDLGKAWQKLQKDNPNISDKHGTFPTMFIGLLVNEYGAVQLNKDEKVDSTYSLKF